MKKLILLTIIAVIWIFGCSKDNPSEPNTPPVPPDTTIVPTGDSTLAEVYCMYLAQRIHHYIPGQPLSSIPGYTDRPVDSLKLDYYGDSLNFQYKYYRAGRWTPVQGHNSQYTIMRKMVWKIL